VRYTPWKFPAIIGPRSAFLLTTVLIVGLLMTSCRRGPVEIVGQTPGAAMENTTKLLLALPLENIGEHKARSVTVHRVQIQDGSLLQPLSLPSYLGDIEPDASKVVQLQFDVPGLSASRTYDLTVEGRYRTRFGLWPRSFIYTTKIQIAPPAPGSATVTSKTGVTHQTNGPYPALPQPPQREGNENRPPTPEGEPRSLHPKTPNSAGVQDPKITSYPGNANGAAAVGFVINTQSNGTNQNFPPDPSAVGSGSSSNVVLATGNLYMKYSTNGGSTFTTISNLSTIFGDQPDGGYCCDQVVHYIPSIDRFVWLIQTNQKTDSKGNVTGPNSDRVAWAKPADIVSNFYGAWTWFDVSSTFLGLGNDWIDFPDVSTANGNLYISTDDVTKGGLVVSRISNGDLQLPGGSNVSWSFTDPTKGTAAVGSHLAQNAAGTMYWAGHNTTSQMRIFAWGDSSSTYSWTDVNNTKYSTSDYTSEAPDGQYWLDPRVKGDSVLGAAFKPVVGGASPPNQIWFAWTAARDSNFKQPYVRMLWVDDQNFKNVGEFQTWNSDYAFAYPALAVNSATSEVAISLMWGGNDAHYMNHAAGFPLDYLLYITTGSNVTFTVNPVSATGCDDASGGKVSGRCTRSGDFLSLRRVGTNSGLFGTLAYEIDLVDSTKSTDCLTSPGCLQNVRWVEFGRPSDVSPPPRPPR
jgi:hypothetical protein